MSERTSGQETGPTAPYVPQNATTGTSDDVVESAFVKWWGEYRPGQYLYDSALKVWRTARTADAERIAALEGELAEARGVIAAALKVADDFKTTAVIKGEHLHSLSAAVDAYRARS